MVKEKEKPHGYIYRATQVDNDKIYIGQTITSRWGENKNPIEERWKREVQEAIRKHGVGEKLRNIEKAIIKYGSEKFNLREQDKAYNQDELDAKERYWVKETDAMNPEKGYNMTEGGLGGKPSPEALERLRERMNSPEYKQKMSQSIKAKYDEDPEYYDKQAKERKERANDPEFIEKMTKINQERAKDPEWLDKMANVNQEIARNPKYREKMSESISQKWEEQHYQENVSKSATDKWQEAKHRERQFKSRVEGKREISDKGQFLKDIQNMKKKEINTKYDMDGKSVNVRIKEMLDHRRVNNFSEAKKYLKNKNLDEVLKDINAKLSEQSNEFKGKKVISNTREFLEDMQNIKLKEITQKYDMNRSTVNRRIREFLGDQGVKNYTELKDYLQDKNLDDVVKRIDEKLKDRSHITEGSTIISDNKQFLKDIQEMQKNEIDQKYGMDAKTVNNKIKEILGDHGVRNYTGAKEYLRDRNLDDLVRDIENRSEEKQDRSSENRHEDKKEESPEESPGEESDDEKQSEERDEGSEDGKGEEPTEQIPEREEITGDGTGEMGESEDKMETKEPPSGSGLQVGDLISIENIDGNNYVVVHDPTNSDEQTPDGLGDSKECDEDPVDSGVDDGGIEDIIDDEGEDSTEEGHKESPEESTDEIIEEEDEEEEERTDNSLGKEEIPKGSSSEITPNESLGKSKGGLTFPEESSTPSSGRTEIIITIEDGKSDIKGWDGVLDEQGKDYDGIDKSLDGKRSDYDGIDTHSEDDKSDIKSLEGGNEDRGNDYEGNDTPQESVDKDYDKLDESYGESGYGG